MSCSKLIHEHSGKACHNGLNIFPIDSTNVSILKSLFRELLPINTINRESPWDFRIFSDNMWLDLSNVYFYIVVSLEKRPYGKTDWVAVDSNDKVAPIQTLGQSIIKTLQIQINGTEVFAETLYPFMCYMKNMLSYSEEVRTTTLISGGYYEDGEDLDSETNKGFVARRGAFVDGTQVELMAKLEFDMANQERYLLNNTDILFTMYKSDDQFLLQTKTKDDKNSYRLNVHQVKLFVKSIDVQPSVNMGIMRMLEKTSAKYPLRRIEMRSCFITSGRTEISYNAFNSVVPRRVVLMLVNNKAYHGDITLNPFKAEPFNLRNPIVEACGQTYPATRYDMRFKAPKNPSYIRAFLDMHDSLNLKKDNASNGITLKKWLKSFAFFVIPLTSTLDDSCGYELVRNGTTTIKLDFNSPIEDPGVCMIIMGEFDALLSIDEQRVVVSDGSV